MFVSDWMSSPPVQCDPGLSRVEARERMVEHSIRRMPVVSEGHLVGIVTVSDTRSQRTGDRVADVMTPDPLAVHPGDTLERAAVIMLGRRVSGLPVLDASDVVGMITETDVFRALVDVLGLEEGGARIILTLQDPSRVLDEVQRRTIGMQLRTLVTYHDPRTGQRKALVRVQGQPVSISPP